jgi:hypothetical protein
MAENLSFRVKNGLVVNNAFLANSTIVSLGANITINTTAYFVNSASTNTTITAGQVAVGANAIVNTTAVYVGNSTVNAVTNSSSIAVSNSTVNTTIAIGQVAVGANAIVNTTAVYVGNSTVNAVTNSSSLAVSNSTVNTNVSIGRIAVGANAIVNTIGVFVNNATANVGSLVNATSVFTGNTTVNTVIDSVSIAVSNSTFNTVINPLSIRTGNATINTVVNSTSIATGNASINTAITAGQISISGVTINSTIYSATANNANNLGGVAAAGYAQLSGATFTGPVVVSNTLSVSNNLTVTGNLIVTGTTMYANVTNLDVKDLNITIAKGVASAAAADGAGLTVDVANVTWNYSHGTLSWQSNVGITPASNNNLSLGTASLVWANVHANNVVGANLYGTIRTTSQPNITANNSTNFGGLSLATVQGQITGNAATAYTNAIAIAANATNLTSGTVDNARLPATIDRTTINAATHSVGSIFVANSQGMTTTANVVIGASGELVLSPGAGIFANGALGTAGQVLHSNGTSVYWDADEAGVTSIATSNGLTGGTITTTGTVSILANTGIIANATGAYVNAAYIATIAANSATGSLTNTFTVGTASYFVANGNVGIANTAPNARLAVTGTANISGNVAIGGITTFGANVVLGSSGLSANGGFGTAGHVLHSNGTATYWAPDDNTFTSVQNLDVFTGTNQGYGSSYTGVFYIQSTGAVIQLVKVYAYNGPPEPPPGPPPCFTADALVAMADGSLRRIDEVLVGEQVIGGFGYINTVLGFHRVPMGNAPMYVINNRHRTSQGHKHWTTAGWAAIDIVSADKPGYVEIVVNNDNTTDIRYNAKFVNGTTTTKLELGMTILTQDGYEVVESIGIDDSIAPDDLVYTLVTDGSHSHFCNDFLVSAWATDTDFDYDTWKPRS